MQFVRNLLGQQRKRAVASIMSAIESVELDDAEYQRLRTTVMAALNQYHDTTLDILKSSVNDGTQVNDAALSLIAKVSQQLNRRT